MKIGYARVSTTAQNLDMQIEALNKAGCEKIYTEKESGVKERPVLKELLSFIRQGDTLVVYKLDRLGRSVRELLAMVDDLREKGISLIALQDNIDATTPAGKMMMQMMAILAEYERNLIIERCQTGRKVAMAAGKKMGRPQEPQTGQYINTFSRRVSRLTENELINVWVYYIHVHCGINMVDYL